MKLQFQGQRYFVQLPWRNEKIDLPNNKQLATGRLNSLVRRFHDKPELLKQYDLIIQDQIDKGIIEEVQESHVDGLIVHYIPHQAVITPTKTTTKVRIVYDGSAKTNKNNLSINDCLYRGSVMLADLCSLLLRFRLNKVAIVADIEKAFLQIGLQKQSRDATRFFWLKSPDKLTTINNLATFRFTRVPFGLISSPFLLAATLAYHLLQNGSETVGNIFDNIYVDNIISGADNVQAAIKLYQETKKILAAASINVREWTSNSNEFFNQLQIEDQVQSKEVKVLGLSWNTQADTSINESNFSISDPSKKREVLQIIASIFDPLGLFSPAILNAKLFMQKLWITKLDWNDFLNSDQQNEWNQIASSLQFISKFNFPRFINVASDNQISYALHCFCDASSQAYGTAIYLVGSTQTKVVSNLIFSKSRLAPKNVLTIPRLELLAILLGVRNLQFISNSLQLSNCEQYLWSDSQCALHWLHTKKPVTIFVSNRIREIKTHSNVNFRFVPGDDNIADLPSRGKKAEELINHQAWWHGPSWLIPSKENWPANIVFNDEFIQQDQNSSLFELSLLVAERSDEKTGQTMINQQQSAKKFIFSENKFSSLNKLINVTAWVLRFINKSRKRSKENSILSVEERSMAKLYWETVIQSNYLNEVIESIQKNSSNKLKKQLGLWLDQDGVIRCGGRLKNVESNDCCDFPKLLPKHSSFTKLVIQEYHHKVLHSGVSSTLSQLRHEYWIPQGRSVVSNYVKKCILCIKLNGSPYKLPAIPALPVDRVTPSAPFSFQGIDYLGPLVIKDKDSQKKVWICVFTCLCVRAIHLELVNDLTAEQFIMGLRRFISRRGTPIKLISDNATNFKLSKKVLDSNQKKLFQDTDVQTYVSQKGID
ncbi:unnamed protein product [Didymodactylos carnosus]|uniref:Integrase catalytic domain-containing protein n=1 Tax=Didymodactylos carnosus TaxID=1234261 RepID=A0A8S2E181_9BILA|nr:unnamed protein product [Didymodactylos carnosus]CAF3826420.1 unnamed protein product [Didymodactylos carnosus]